MVFSMWEAKSSLVRLCPMEGAIDCARGHLEVGDQAPGTVANVLVLLKLAASFARLHRKGRMETLQSLDGGLLVGGDHMHALLIA
jgi:hypothetical protein